MFDTLTNQIVIQAGIAVLILEKVFSFLKAVILDKNKKTNGSAGERSVEFWQGQMATAMEVAFQKSSGSFAAVLTNIINGQAMTLTEARAASTEAKAAAQRAVELGIRMEMTLAELRIAVRELESRIPDRRRGE